LHHVIIRGIEKREIVADDEDRDIFVSRMGAVAYAGFNLPMALKQHFIECIYRTARARLIALLCDFSVKVLE